MSEKTSKVQQVQIEQPLKSSTPPTTPDTSPTFVPLSANGRRYPTLAQMAAITSHASSTDSDLAVDEIASTPTVSLVEPPLATVEEAGEAAVDEMKTTADPIELSSWDIPGTVAAANLQHEQVADMPAPRVPVRTRRLREERAEREGATAPATRIATRITLSETDPLLREYPVLRPQPLPETNLVVPIAVIETGVAAVASISLATILLTRSSGAFWAASLAVIALLGGALAYFLARDVKRERSAGTILLASQLGMLAWLMGLVGPRASLLALVPVLLLLSLRITSRLIAGAGVAVALATYGCVTILSLNQVLRPAIQMNSPLLAVLDGVFVVIGMGLLLVAVLDIHASRQKAEILARARLRELRQVRSRAAQLRQESEEDATRLQDALVAAIYGRDDLPPELQGPLSPLNELLDQLGERMAMLQRDREERLRLDGALRRLTRAVERAWLGLPWTWPEPSGTALDELVALLRTPNPRDVSQQFVQETPALVPIPSDDPSLTPPPWEAPALHPRVHEHLSDPAWSFSQYPKHLNGANNNNNNSNGNTPRPARRNSPASGPASRISPLPWLEWDEWRDWDDRFSS